MKPTVGLTRFFIEKRGLFQSIDYEQLGLIYAVDFGAITKKVGIGSSKNAVFLHLPPVF